ncbi:MAG: hypothetical protein AAFR52_08830 [Pseudomonadota bacterium]
METNPGGACRGEAQGAGPDGYADALKGDEATSETMAADRPGAGEAETGTLLATLTSREVTLPFVAGAAAGFGAVSVHSEPILETLGPGMAVALAVLGGLSAFTVMISRIPRLSMSEGAMLACVSAMVLTLAASMGEQTRADGSAPAAPEAPGAPEGGGIRFSPGIGALDIGRPARG